MLRSWAILLLLLTPLAACKPQDELTNLSKLAASPTGGRTTAASAIAADWTSKTITLNDAIDRAYEQLECVATGAPPVYNPTLTSTEATDFAGALLDALDMLGNKVPKTDDYEIFWMRVGRVAFRAAEEAHAAGRLKEARSLVLAGPQRWQNDAYWQMHRDHDALASVILARNGERSEAIHRLESRADLDGPALEVYEMLKAGK